MAEDDDYQIEDQPFLIPLPLDAVRCDPQGLGTADCSTVCRCRDGCDYAIKDTKGAHHFTPHAEWFCTHLASAANLAGPPCKLVRMPDQSIAFGSRWEGGVVDKQRPWFTRVHDNEIPLQEIAPILSRIYAFDHFVHNWDRHGDNFLCRESRSSHIVLSFDYSRAWVCNGFPLPQLPFTDDPTKIESHTRIVRRQLASLWGNNFIEPRECSDLLEILRKIPKHYIEKIIGDHPKEWLTDTMRTLILDWWQSDEMDQRIDGIRKGITDGSYL